MVIKRENDKNRKFFTSQKQEVFKVTKKCIYCGRDVPDEAVIDFCDICGERVWGKKMFETIKKNMEDARERGDLCISLQKETTVSPPKKSVKYSGDE